MKIRPFTHNYLKQPKPNKQVYLFKKMPPFLGNPIGASRYTDYCLDNLKNWALLFFIK